MTTLTSWVDYQYAEQAAAVMVRGLSGASSAWGELLADAQTILAHRSDTRDSEHLMSYGFDDWSDLVSAARILDLAGTDGGLGDHDNRRTAAILAACAFGMSGTFVSAKAVIDSHGLLNSELTPGELTALAISSPTLSREVFLRIGAGTSYRECLEGIIGYLANGGDALLDSAKEALERTIQNESSVWEGYLLRLSRLSLAHLGRLATAKVLGPYVSRLPVGYLGRLVADSPILLPSQYEAIDEHGVLDPERNLLVALPTGTGKTLLGELALLSALGREPGIVCYIAPYVALGRQVAEKISRHTPRDVQVRTFVGGYREPAPLDPENDSIVVIATPERFDAMIRLRRDLLPYVRCVVIDEAHIIGNGQRGIRVEGILTRLRLAGLGEVHTPRVVLLSAVLSNVDALANWLGIQPSNIIRGSWRPSAKRTLRWSEDGDLTLYAGDDPLRERPSEVLGKTRLPWPNRGFYPATHIGQINQQEPLALGNVAYLAEHQYDQYKQPILCICSTRPKTRRLAAQIAERFEPIEPVPPRIQGIADLIDRKYQYLRSLKEALLRGVAYHNASLPYPVRDGIERAVEDRALKVVASTTTLAEGVDLPFRVTILVDWITFDGEKSRPMESLLFKNISGRCGRAGQFTEGDTVIFDNPVGDSQLTSPARRPALQQDIFFTQSQPALASAVNKLTVQDSVAMVGSQLLAAIPENPELDDLLGSFFRNSFVYRTDGADEAQDRISLAFREILEKQNGQALAVFSSPARLTPFGEAASTSGLSPRTAWRLRDEMRKFDRPGVSRETLLEISAALLSGLGNVTEQRNGDLRKAVENPRSRPVVHLNDIRLVLNQWLDGESLETIFSNLPSNRRSSRTPNLQTWLQGVSTDSTWNEQFTKFNDFVGDCFEFFLPWLLNAARPIAEIDGHLERPWLDWARFIELGVDNTWAVRILDDDIVMDREIANQIGRQIDALDRNGLLSVELAVRVVSDVLGQDTTALGKVTAWFPQQKIGAFP